MEFTNEEQRKIDELYGSGFKGIKPEDVPLIQKWEQHKTSLQMKRDAEIQAMNEENAARLAKIKQETEYAAETLKILRDKAVARYRGGVDGQTE